MFRGHSHSELPVQNLQGATWAGHDRRPSLNNLQRGIVAYASQWRKRVGVAVMGDHHREGSKDGWHLHTTKRT